jgi:Tfp pilus assembly protein PilF
MPNLAALAREGRAGTVTTLHPALSPLVWTTMMTGAGPLEHGILDFTRFNPSTGVKEPITSDERRAPAIWNMASAAGKSVAVFGMWATYPAEPVRGLLVSDRLFSFQYGEKAPPPGIVHPPGREEWARQALGRAEDAVGFAVLREYLPWLEEAEYREIIARPDPYAHAVSALRRILIETRVHHALAVETIARDRPDLAVVYIQGTDAIGHVFAPFAPPKRPGVPAADFERYSRVPETYFSEVDRLLHDYRKLAEDSGAVLMIASDHGFLWQDGRPSERSSLAAATAGKWHRDEGIYLVWGPGVTPPGPVTASEMAPDARWSGDRRAPAGSVRQVCSTLLALLGLPADVHDAAGPLPGVTPAPGERADYRGSFRQPAGGVGSLAGALPPGRSPEADTEALAKLRSLGYIGAGEAMAAPPPDSRGRSSTRTAGSYNTEGLILREQGKNAEAAAAFEEAIRIEPGHASALWNLSDLLFEEQRDPDRADDLLALSLARGLPDGVARVVGRVMAYRSSGKSARGLMFLDRSLRVQSAEPDLWLLRGRDRIEAGDCSGALADFREATRLAPDSALGHASSGLARLCLNDRQAAMGDFRRSLEIDPDQPELLKHVQP